MASIRYRAPWRVMVKGDDKPKGVFVSKTQAAALRTTLIQQGIDKDSINLVQERKGTWEARVRRQGGRVLLKSFPTKTAASAWAEEREGEIVKGAFVDCLRRPKIDHPRRLKFDQGREAVLETAICG